MSIGAKHRPWSDSRVLVTGANGFLGSWLVKDLLQRGAAVVALVRDQNQQSELFLSGDARRITIASGQLEDFALIERAIVENEVDTVFHLAAQPIVSVARTLPLQTFESNIRGTYNLLEACRLHMGTVRRVIVASSDKAYGEQEILPYTEGMPLAGREPYELSKGCVELLAQGYHHTYKLPVAIARCGNIYGGGDLNWSRIVPGLIRSFLEKQRPIIRSDGTYVRDYIYVKDAVLAYMALADGFDRGIAQGEAFNFSPERPLNVLQVAEVIQKAMKCEDIKLDIQNTASGEIKSQYLCSQKAKEILQWQSKYTFEQAIAETIDWYRKFISQQKV